MNFWFYSTKILRVPSYKYILKLKIKVGTVKKKPITNVKFVRQQKVFGKGGGKNIIKKKTNLLVRSLKIYFLSGAVQNLPPLSTLLSIFNINTQKLCDEISLVFKNDFFEGVPVSILIDVFKDCSHKFFLIDFRFNYLIQSLTGFSKIKKKLFLSSNKFKNMFDIDLWFFLIIKYFFFGKKFFFESCLKSYLSTIKVLGINRMKNYFFINEN